MKYRYLALVAALILLAASPALAQFKKGDSAPDFTARTLDDQPIKLSDLKGQVLLVEMGATWCPSCNELAHQIDGIREFLKEKDIQLVDVYLADSPSAIKEHLAKEKLKDPDQIMIDSGEARRSYGIFSIPRLLLIDKDQKIIFDAMVLDAKEIQKRINGYLK